MNGFDVVQVDDGYDVRCQLCDYLTLGVETLETAGHLGELHVEGEHFDE